MKIALACDHAAFDFKQRYMEWLKEEEYQCLDFGTFSEESVDYPDFAFPAAEAVAAGVADFGVILCGSGVGVNITCNKVRGIRAALCMTEEMALLARNHNNANVLNFGARLVDFELGKKIIKTFLEEEFLGDRHMIRVEKIHKLSGW